MNYIYITLPTILVLCMNLILKKEHSIIFGFIIYIAIKILNSYNEYKLIEYYEIILYILISLNIILFIDKKKIIKNKVQTNEILSIYLVIVFNLIVNYIYHWNYFQLYLILTNIFLIYLIVKDGEIYMNAFALSIAFNLPARYNFGIYMSILFVLLISALKFIKNNK